MQRILRDGGPSKETTQDMGKENTIPSIIQIDDCLVSSEILTEYFACDYGKCRGCCCIVGDSGAPLDESEPEAIEKEKGKKAEFEEKIGKAKEHIKLLESF